VQVKHVIALKTTITTRTSLKPLVERELEGAQVLAGNSLHAQSKQQHMHGSSPKRVSPAYYGTKNHICLDDLVRQRVSNTATAV